MDYEDFETLPQEAIKQAEKTIRQLREQVVRYFVEYDVEIFGNNVRVAASEYVIDHNQPARAQLRPSFTPPIDGHAPALYCIETCDDASAERIRRRFKELRVSIADRKLPQDNARHDLTRCLYVGSSVSAKSNAGARLCQHLGFMRGRLTYALNLNRLTVGEPLGLLIRIGWYPGASARLVQVLEEAMWDQKRPLFGRRGH